MRLKNANHLISHIRNLLASQMDVNIEIRGPKGWGKSALALGLCKALSPGFQEWDALAYSHEDYARRYRQIRERRKGGNRDVQVIWVDDAARLFDRRGHMTKKNRAMLTINRTMRSQLGAVQILLTQDDLLEQPLREGGNYVLFILDRPFHAYHYWLKGDPLYRSEPRLMRGFPMRWPNPNVAYPVTWAQYQVVRQRMTDDLTDELLADIAPEERERVKRKAVKPEAVLALRAEGLTQADIGVRLGISRQRVAQLLGKHGQIESNGPGNKPLGSIKNGESSLGKLEPVSLRVSTPQDPAT